MLLVTGATGHVGNTLVGMLEGRGPIRVLVQPHEDMQPLDGRQVEIVCGDIRNPKDVARAVEGCEVVYHLAGLIDISPRHPNLLMEVNVQGTGNVVDACLRQGVRKLVYCSSVHALPEPVWGETLAEGRDFPYPNLLGAYARSKTEATAKVYAAMERGLDATVVFPSGIIGPNDYRVSEMGKVIRALVRRRNVKRLPVFEGAYNFVDVRDVCQVLLQLPERDLGGRGFVLAGHIMTVEQLYRSVLDLVGSHPKLWKVPTPLVRAASSLVQGWSFLTRKKPFFTPYSIDVLLSNPMADSSLAERELGFHPRPLEESMADSVHWMLEHGLLDAGKRRKQPLRLPSSAIKGT